MSYHPGVDAEGRLPVGRQGSNGVRMEQEVQRLISPTASRRARLWLATTDGRTLPPRIAPIYGPETPMKVSFEGLSEEEQRVALAAFPGGKRFVLAS